ncbi:MAG: hypothetical protein E6902_14445 [Paeniclostridium sordellii]|nr:hypothetical protein [Paeniclostridium sordellii]
MNIDNESKLTEKKSVVIYDEYLNIEQVQEINKNQTVQVVNEYTDQQKYMMNRNRNMKEFIECNEGNFIHSLYKYCYPYMLELQLLDEGSKNNIHIIRFIILCTYLSKDGYVRFESRKIKKSRLIRIWKLKDSKESKKTYEKLKEINYIFEDEEGYIMINSDIVVNGKVEGFKQLKKCDENTTYTRLFSKNIQDMYYNTSDRDRKQLAILFKLLPFVNFKYNVFCSNPQETDRKKLELCNWKDLARICGYNESNSTRLKNELMKLRIYDCLAIGMFTTIDGNAICINPKIYYGGSDISEVEYLYSLFEMCDKRNSKIN